MPFMSVQSCKHKGVNKILGKEFFLFVAVTLTHRERCSACVIGYLKDILVKSMMLSVSISEVITLEIVI